MPDNNSPWGSSGGSNGGGKSPWGSGGKKPGRRSSGKPQPADLDNVIRGFKTKFGGGGPVKRGGSGPSGLSMPLIIAGIGLVMLAMSCFYTVAQQEEAVVLRFGEYQRTVTSGLHFKFPTPVESVMKRNVETQRSVGSQNNLVLTNDENIANIDFTVLWNIKNVENYIFNIENPADVVSDAADSALREVVGKTDLGPLITDQRSVTENQVLVLLQEMLDGYKAGVKITNVQLQRAEAPPSVLESFDNVVKAEQDLEKKVNQGIEHRNKVTEEAVGEAAKLVEAAEAYKREVVVISQGEADRFLAVLKEYKLAPRVTRQRIYLEAMETVLGSSEKIIMDNKAGAGVVPYLPLDKLIQKPRAGK